MGTSLCLTVLVVILHLTVQCMKGKNFEDYIVEFEQPETATCAQLTDDGLINNNDRIPVLDHETVIPVKHSLFYKDALIFDQLEITHGCIKT